MQYAVGRLICEDKGNEDGDGYKKDVKFHFAQLVCRPLSYLPENNDKSSFILVCIFVVLNMQSTGAGGSALADVGLTATTCCRAALLQYRLATVKRSKSYLLASVGQN
jgi:hypothetical protein